jgi:RNA polymerase sigma factor (sigma-70 family)
VAIAFWERRKREPGFDPKDRPAFVRAAVAYMLAADRVAAKNRDARALTYLKESGGDERSYSNPDRMPSVASDLAAVIQKAIKELPRRRGQVFLMVRQDKMSYKQAAEAAGISEAAVNQHVTRAQDHIRKAIADFRSREERGL